MFSQFLVNATDIDLWSQRLNARSELPRLARRLVLATTPRIERLHFAADEGVQTGGWDGIVHASNGSAFVPDGTSVWEMGANSDIKGKADDDYDKRTQNPLGLDKKNTTFVFVTPRRWSGKEKWAQNRHAEGEWREVRAYDADDLETWLERAPAVHWWLSRWLGKSPQGARTLEEFWHDWADKTRPSCVPRLVIGGRVESRQEIEAWLQAPPSSFVLQGESQEEALAFFGGVVIGLAQEQREPILARSLIVESADAWRALLLCDVPCLLVPRFEGEVEGVSRAVQKGHHVFIPTDARASSASASLPRLVRDEAEAALKEMGLPSDKASELATLARRSLPALRRKIASSPTLARPHWAQGQAARELLWPLLVSTWHDNNPADRAILSDLAGLDYDAMKTRWVEWSQSPDAPLRFVGGVWMVAAPEDAWRLLASQLTDEDLHKFRAVAVDLLSRVTQRPRSLVIQGWPNEAPPEVSGQLREGIAGMLALMAARSDEVKLPFSNGVAGTGVARGIVRAVLENAKSDPNIWAALSSPLPLLAEAAPTEFLEAVDAGLKGEPPFLLSVFDTAGDSSGFGPTSPHTYLLWALETLAWNSDHLSRAALCLARLARIDPGGRTANRPAASLGQIFVLWYPNTTASLEKRLRVLDVIRKHEPAVAWHLLLRLLPSSHGGTCQHPHAPKWHDWKPDAPHSITHGEHFAAVEGVFGRLLSDAGIDAGRWSQLLGRVGDLWPSFREKFLEKLEQLDEALFSIEERANLCEQLRRIIHQHRHCANADWAIDAEMLGRLQAVQGRLYPADAVLEYRWLFQGFVPLTEFEGHEDWQAREAQLLALRTSALSEILAQCGLEGVFRLAAELEKPEGAETVGFALSGLPDGVASEDEFLFENLCHEQLWRAALAWGWARRKGWPWEEGWLLARLEASRGKWRPQQRGELMRLCPLNAQTLDMIDGLEDEARRHFWSRVSFLNLSDLDELAEGVVERLIEAGRAAFALQPVHWAIHENPNFFKPELIFKTLERAIADADIAALSNSYHDSAELLDHLFKIGTDRERLAGLEWLYYGLHKDYRAALALQDTLDKDAGFFVELIKLASRARPGETETVERDNRVPFVEEGENDSKEQEWKELLAERAYDVLFHWHRIPGLQEDGTLNGQHLKDWVSKARELGQANNRAVITLIHIAHLLAHSPRDPDGAWPHSAVRDIIEEVANPRLDNDFHSQVFNNRGMTSRGLTDGGVQERELAATYEKDAEQIADFWPRSASVLRGIAQDYHRRADDEDRSADLTQDFWR